MSDSIACDDFILPASSTQLTVAELSQLEAVSRQMKDSISFEHWQICSSCLPASVSFKSKIPKLGKSDLKQLLSAIEGSLVLQPGPVDLESRKLAKDLTVLARKARSRVDTHLASGGRIGRVLVCKFHFSLEDVPLIGKPLLETGPGRPGDKKRRFDIESEAIEVPGQVAGNGNASLTLKLAFVKGAPFLRVKESGTADVHAAFLFDIWAVTESLCLRMQDAYASSNGASVKGSGICFIQNAAKLSQEIAGGLLCVLSVRDVDSLPASMSPFQQISGVDALSIDLSHAALIRT